jgi:hypothetical protein
VYRQHLIVMVIEHGYAEYGETMARISNVTLVLAINYFGTASKSARTLVPRAGMTAVLAL